MRILHTSRRTVGAAVSATVGAGVGGSVCVASVASTSRGTFWEHVLLESSHLHHTIALHVLGFSLSASVCGDEAVRRAREDGIVREAERTATTTYG